MQNLIAHLSNQLIVQLLILGCFVLLVPATLQSKLLMKLFQSLMP
uniref:Uncharacterized protein n=1 Tax=Rhizophora mucronata TaxID=61149 RepID=A0A2P2R1T3_RHIMU